MMTKEDWIWVAIRIFGIFLIVKAITALPDVVGGVAQASQWRSLGDSRCYRGDLSEEFRVFDELRSTAFTVMVSRLMKAVARVALFAVCGVYFLRGGRLIFRLIRPPSCGPAPPHEPYP